MPEPLTVRQSAFDEQVQYKCDALDEVQRLRGVIILARDLIWNGTGEITGALDAADLLHRTVADDEYSEPAGSGPN